MIWVVRVERCASCLNEVAWTNDDRFCQGCLLRRMSPTAKRVFRAIQEHGPVPLAEIADHVGFASASSVHFHLRTLRKAGLIQWEPNKQATLLASSSVPHS